MRGWERWVSPPPEVPHATSAARKEASVQANRAWRRELLHGDGTAAPVDGRTPAARGPGGIVAARTDHGVTACCTSKPFGWIQYRLAATTLGPPGAMSPSAWHQVGIVVPLKPI